MEREAWNYKINFIYNSIFYEYLENKVYLKNKIIYFNNEFLMNVEEPRKIKEEFILVDSQILGFDLKKDGPNNQKYWTFRA